MAKSDEIVPGMAKAIEERRKWAKLNPGEFAKAAGVTTQGLAPIRKGYRRNYQDKLKLGVATALQWPDDAVDRLLAGADPKTFPTIQRTAAVRTDNLARVVGSDEAAHSKVEHADKVLAQMRERIREIEVFEAHFVEMVRTGLADVGYDIMASPTSGGADFWTDVDGRRVLIEVKASTTRPDLRATIGQMLEYRHWARRNLGLDDVVVAVVTPHEPGDDWVDIFRDAGVIITWPPDYEQLLEVLTPAQASELQRRAAQASDLQRREESLAALRAEGRSARTALALAEAASSGQLADDDEPRTTGPTDVPEEPGPP